jgi:hypothetical protein
MNSADATRVICWNITHVWVMYVLMVPALLIAGYGIYRHVRLWQQGRPVRLRFKTAATAI